MLLFGQIPGDPGELTRSLGEAGLHVEARAAGSPEALAKALDERAGHVILAYLAEDAAVRDLAALAQRHDPSAPIVVVATGAAPARTAALIRAGARDAAPAADAERLAAVIEREAAVAQQARDAAALAQRVVRLEHIVEHVPVMLFSKKVTTLEVDLWNRTAEELSGVSRHLMVGKTAWDLFPNEAAIYDKVDREVLANKVPVNLEEPISTPRGERWLFTSKVPVLDASGEAISLLCVSLDITDRRAAAQALVETNRKLAESESAKLELIERLRYSIDELSNPILEVWDDVLAMPIIGVVDSRRTADMVQRLLTEVARTQASFVIVDLTGVEIVDTSTADHLMKLMRKVEIIGARCVLTGIRPAVAETLVDIGVDFGRITTLRNLKHGLREALRHAQREREQRRELGHDDEHDEGSQPRARSRSR
ncbi:MAG: PAS domain-containing protein [Byssovorax sp.]